MISFNPNRFPTTGSFQTVDGVRFVFRTDLGAGRNRPGWTAGALAHDVMLCGPNGTQPAIDGKPYRHRVGSSSYSSLVPAALTAIRQRKKEVQEARNLIAAYDAAYNLAYSGERVSPMAKRIKPGIAGNSYESIQRMLQVARWRPDKPEPKKIG